MAEGASARHAVGVRQSLGLIPSRNETEKPLSSGIKYIMKTENKSETRKGSNRLRPILALARATACMTLASCVYPYENGQHGLSSVITTYQPGYRTTSLPSGYRTESISGRNYYYHNGSYYQRKSDGYIVIDAPRESRYYPEYNRSRQVVRPEHQTTVTTYQPGHRFNSLPSGYRSENLGGSTYYYHNGAYYQRNSEGYVVTEAPRHSRYYTDYTRYR